MPLYVRSLDFRTYKDFSGLSWFDFPSRYVPGVFLLAGSLDPFRQNSGGIIFSDQYF